MMEFPHAKGEGRASHIAKRPNFDYPAWAFMEVIAFGTFAYFYKRLLQGPTTTIPSYQSASPMAGPSYRGAGFETLSVEAVPQAVKLRNKQQS